MTSSIKVLKFGGTSVADTAAFERAARIVHDCDAPVVVVVSAMSGVTDALIKSICTAASGETAAAIATLKEHFARHLHVAESLRPKALARWYRLIASARDVISELLTRGSGDLRTQDAITSYGEILCAGLFMLILEHHGVPASYVDARRCILTDGEHGNATPLINEVNLRTSAELKPLLEAKMVPVLLSSTVGSEAWNSRDLKSRPH